MSKAQTFLSHCRKVKETGRGAWIACCLGHEDRNPSMTVRELDDGRVLVHCFAGCSVQEILGAIGLGFEALFPDTPISQHISASRSPWPAKDVLAALADEADVLMIVVGDIEEGRPLKESDIARARLARQRIRDAVDLATSRGRYGRR